MRTPRGLAAACLALVAFSLPFVASGETKSRRSGPKPIVLPDLRERGEGYRVAGRWAMAAPRSIAFMDGILLVGSGGNILAYDVSGGTPKLLSVVQTPGLVSRMCSYAQRLYVANDSGGVRVIDYKRANKPVDLGGVSEWYKVRDVVVTEDLVLLAVHEDGLSIRKRSNLEEISRVKLPGYVRRVEMLGTTAFVTSGGGSGREGHIDLYAVDVSDPSSPKVSREKYDSNTKVYDFAVFGRLGYLAEGTGGLNVVGLAGTTRFKRLGSFVSQAVSVARDNDLLYSAGGRSFLVLDPSRTPPPLRGVYEADNVLGLVAARGKFAAVSLGGTKVLVLDIGRPTTPSVVATLDFPGNTGAIFTEGNIVYAASSGHFEVLDVSDRAAPVRIAELAGSGVGQDIWVQGGVAYVATGFGLAIANVGEPESPAVAGYIGLQTGEERYEGVAVQGTALYAASGGKGLLIADVSNPSNPTVISMTDMKSWSHDLWVEGKIAYVADKKGLALVDVSDAAAPKIMNYIDTPGEARDIVARDGIAYVADKNVGIEIYDCRDPMNPVQLSKLEQLPTCEAVDLKGNLLYVAAVKEGVYVVDVADPKAPRIVGSIPTPGVALNVSAGEDFIAVADYRGGVTILERISDDSR